jgi:putative SOS response-associated peptidase YedK
MPETVETAPSYREAFRKRRCLLPADGFYEWRTIGGAKIPFAIEMKDDRPFAFAGLLGGVERSGYRRWLRT